MLDCAPSTPLQGVFYTAKTHWIPGISCKWKGIFRMLLHLRWSFSQE